VIQRVALVALKKIAEISVAAAQLLLILQEQTLILTFISQVSPTAMLQDNAKQFANKQISSQTIKPVSVFTESPLKSL
jgi:hypothetical protein